MPWHAGAQPATILAQPWLRSARWDLTYLTLSVVLVAVPYSVYILFGGAAFEDAAARGTPAYNARVLVNNLVAVVIGGPHMYATFTRTVADRDFFRKRRLFVLASFAVPAVVFGAAVLSYESYVWLLSIFFAMASLHALQQIVWLTEAYNQKAGVALSLWSRLIDYGVVLTSLYPIAIQRMVRGDFKIGPVDLKFNAYVQGWHWLGWLAAAAFGAMLVLFIAKTVAEARAGYVNVPKVALIGTTALIMFWAPSFPNLDTAFQGINAWHSFQYLALTWYANRLREEATGETVGFLRWLRGAPRGEGNGSLRARLLGALARVDGGAGWATFYALCLAMLPISGLLMLLASVGWPEVHAGRPGADEAYTYMGVLSILLVHYVQDALLFTDSRALVR